MYGKHVHIAKTEIRLTKKNSNNNNNNNNNDDNDDNDDDDKIRYNAHTIFLRGKMNK